MIYVQKNLDTDTWEWCVVASKSVPNEWHGGYVTMADAYAAAKAYLESEA